MSWAQRFLLERLLGIEGGTSVESLRIQWGSAWGEGAAALVWLGLIAAAGVAVWFYLSWQKPLSPRLRWTLIALRVTTLGLVVIALAEPVLQLKLARERQPVLWVLLDGSTSMNLVDAPGDGGASLSSGNTSSVHPAAGIGSARDTTRAEQVRQWLTQAQNNVLGGLSKDFQLQFYRTDSGAGTVSLPNALPHPGEPQDSSPAPDSSGTEEMSVDKLLGRVAEDWQPDTSTTAIGTALESLTRRPHDLALAGVVVVSDFDQNAGPPAAPIAKTLGVPVYTIGVGAMAVRDLSVAVSAPPTLKQGEGATVTVTIRQNQLDQAMTRVKVWAEPMVSGGVGTAGRIPIGEQTVQLTGSTLPIDFRFIPGASGRFNLVAEVEPASGESIVHNNSSEREVRVIDDFLRLLYVEYEPTWEWRFVKEVFHRDRLVGLRGFRTFLRSSDPVVRQSNPLFVPNLTLPRNEFFETDVIFLGDLPASALTTRFCEMTKEFVGQFGGGLVILSGPRFGPAQLADTPLAELLPVVIEGQPSPRRDQSFSLSLTPLANQFDFMHLASGGDLDSAADGQASSGLAAAWKNLGNLHWYQPVTRLASKSTAVLAEHPTDLCADGKTHQPLIAIRKYGKGEVVYVAFNELWRLRKHYGETYYRQFWGQLIYRLGLSHALGPQKRFVVRSDREQYRGDESPVITTEAYTREFTPLSSADFAGGALSGKLSLTNASSTQPVTLAELRPGLFETQLGTLPGGDYQLEVTDPVTMDISTVAFSVTSSTAEQRSIVRNVGLEQALAGATGGDCYDLSTAHELDRSLPRRKVTESNDLSIPLWNTWLMFLCVLACLFGEWLLRKRVHLP